MRTIDLRVRGGQLVGRGGATQPALWADETTTGPAEVRLADWDLIVVYTSGGKDSAACMVEVAERARREGVLGRVVAVHADLGLVEWDASRTLAEQQARQLGVTRFEVVSRGETLLDYALRRGKWPSAAARWCTSDLKRGPCERLVRRLAGPLTPQPGVDRVRVLEVYGMRAQESAARAKQSPWQVNPRLTTKAREVVRWLVLHAWTTTEVFARADAAGLPRHPAYQLGQSRASCVLCIFLSRDELVRAARARPKLAQFYAAVEGRIGHRFRERLPMAEVLDAAGIPLLPPSVLDPVLDAPGEVTVADVMAVTPDPLLEPRPELDAALTAAGAGVGG